MPEISVDLLRETQLGRLVKRYFQHDEAMICVYGRAFRKEFGMGLDLRTFGTTLGTLKPERYTSDYVAAVCSLLA